MFVLFTFEQIELIQDGFCLFAGAPRLLQAIARDDIMPVLRPFRVLCSCNNEPLRALLFTLFLASIGIAIGDLELVAPLIDV